jgi:hypothetical protein
VQVSGIVRPCERESGEFSRGALDGGRNLARATRDALGSGGVLDRDRDVSGFDRGGVAAWCGSLTAVGRMSPGARCHRRSRRDIRGNRRDGQKRECDPPDGCHVTIVVCNGRVVNRDQWPCTTV